MKTKNTASVRWLYLAVGTVTMLFAGIIYAWSILKTPLATEFGWALTATVISQPVKEMFIFFSRELPKNITLILQNHAVKYGSI